MATIFIVDDNLIQQRRYESELSGHTLIAAISSKQARELFAANKDTIDIIVLDGELASMDPEGDTRQMASDFRAAGFAGPMIAASGNPWLKHQLIQKGLCNFQIEFMKSEVSELVSKILAIAL